MTEASKTHEVKVERKRGAVPAPLGTGMQVVQSLRDEVENIFQRFSRAFSAPAIAPRGLFDVGPFRQFETSFGVAAPAVDIIETDKDFQIKVDLPGFDESNVDISLSGDVLAIRGEKSESKEEKEGSYRLSERRYGSFQRSFYLPDGVDRDRITAKFDKGVLTITMPKTVEAVKHQRKISISK